MASPFIPLASQPDVMLCGQKDSLYLDYLRPQLVDVFERLLGGRVASAFIPEVRRSALHPSQ